MFIPKKLIIGKVREFLAKLIISLASEDGADPKKQGVLFMLDDKGDVRCMSYSVSPLLEYKKDIKQEEIIKYITDD